MVRPRVARRFRRSVGCGSCINVSGLMLEPVVLRAIMDISARAISLASRPRPGHQGHQCSHAPGRPILHLVSSSRRPRRVTGVEVTSSVAPHLVQFLRSCLAAILSSRPARVRDTHADRGTIVFLAIHSKLRSLLRTAQAMRASLLASAIANTLRCSRFLAASIHALSP